MPRSICERAHRNTAQRRCAAEGHQPPGNVESLGKPKGKLPKWRDMETRGEDKKRDTGVVQWIGNGYGNPWRRPEKGYGSSAVDWEWK